MPSRKLTKSQKAVINYLQEEGAVSSDTAAFVYDHHKAADNLARAGILNHIWNKSHGEEYYWIRQPNEKPNGNEYKYGYIVVLNTNILHPDGKKKNMFLIRAVFDGRQKTFEAILKKALKKLNLKVSNITSSIEMILYDDSIFNSPNFTILEYTKP